MAKIEASRTKHVGKRGKQAATVAPDEPPLRLGIPQFARVPAHAWIGPRTDQCLIVVFVAVLLLPMMAWVFKKGQAASLGENRRLASMPSLADQPYEKWPSLIDTYFRDNFGLRNRLIHANNVLLRVWLGLSSENLIIGKDRWAFYRITNERNLENHLGLIPLTQQQMQNWKVIMEAEQNRRAALNIQSLFVIAPDKESVYPEMLPSYFRVGRSRVDQLMEYLRETTSNLNVLDLRPVLVAAKQDGVMYFPHDTHWNGRGYFAGYRAISKRLREWFPDLPMQQLGTNFGVKRIPSADGVWGMVGLPEENFNFPYEVLAPIDSVRAERLPSALPPGVGDPEAPWLKAVRTQSPGGRHRLLLLHDSFMSYGVENRVEGPLTRDFESVLSIGRWQELSSKQALENSFHPDVVIDVCVERLVILDP